MRAHASAGVRVSVTAVPGGAAAGAMATVTSPAPAGVINVAAATAAPSIASTSRRLRPPKARCTAGDHRTFVRIFSAPDPVEALRRGDFAFRSRSGTTARVTVPPDERNPNHGDTGTPKGASLRRN